MSTENIALGSRLYRLYLLSFAITLIGNLGIRVGKEAGVMPGWVAVALAIAAVVPLGVTAARFRKALTSDFDEMLQRIVLEGFSFSLVLYFPMAALYMNLRSAGVPVPRLDPPDVIMIPAGLVGLGLLLAARRYR